MARANANGQNTRLAETAGSQSNLCTAAHALCDYMDAADYKQVVLGFTLFTYICYAFKAKDARLKAHLVGGRLLQKPDAYRVVSIFIVSTEAQSSRLKPSLPQDTVSKPVGGAIAAIDLDNPLSRWAQQYIHQLAPERGSAAGPSAKSTIWLKCASR
jgi:hypothetical protein